MSDEIIGCLINWRRPNNVPKILQAMRDQSTRINHIVLLECSPNSEFAVSPAGCALADTVISISTNTGPICRLLPSLLFPSFKYTYFAVDDHIPGYRHVEWLVRTAGILSDNFATIGMDGRNIRNGEIVKRKARLAESLPIPIDVVTTSELMLTELAPKIMDWRHKFRNGIGSGCSFLEDDLFICFAGQDHSGHPSYLAPSPPAPEYNWTVSKLHAPHALCGRPDHKELRDHFVRCAQEFGWHSRGELIERQAGGTVESHGADE